MTYNVSMGTLNPTIPYYTGYTQWSSGTGHTHNGLMVTYMTLVCESHRSQLCGYHQCDVQP